MISEDLSIISETLFLLPFFFLTSADCDHGLIVTIFSTTTKAKKKIKWKELVITNIYKGQDKACKTN